MGKGKTAYEASIMGLTPFHAWADVEPCEQRHALAIFSAIASYHPEWAMTRIRTSDDELEHMLSNIHPENTKCDCLKVRKLKEIEQAAPNDLALLAMEALTSELRKQGHTVDEIKLRLDRWYRRVSGASKGVSVKTIRKWITASGQQITPRTRGARVASRYGEVPNLQAALKDQGFIADLDQRKSASSMRSAKLRFAANLDSLRALLSEFLGDDAAEEEFNQVMSEESAALMARYAPDTRLSSRGADSQDVRCLLMHELPPGMEVISLHHSPETWMKWMGYAMKNSLAGSEVSGKPAENLKREANHWSRSTNSVREVKEAKGNTDTTDIISELENGDLMYEDVKAYTDRRNKRHWCSLSTDREQAAEELARRLGGLEGGAVSENHVSWILTTQPQRKVRGFDFGDREKVARTRVDALHIDMRRAMVQQLREKGFDDRGRLTVTAILTPPGGGEPYKAQMIITHNKKTGDIHFDNIYGGRSGMMGGFIPVATMDRPSAKFLKYKLEGRMHHRLSGRLSNPSGRKRPRRDRLQPKPPPANVGREKTEA